MLRRSEGKKNWAKRDRGHVSGLVNVEKLYEQHAY